MNKPIPDKPLTDEEWVKLIPPIRGVKDLPEIAKQAVKKTMRGRPVTENPKQKIAIRLDPDILSHFKENGKGWQSRINAALRKAAGL